MKTGRKEHEQSQLLSHLEPSVQPVGKSRVFGAPDDLNPGGNHAGQVAGGQHGDGVDGEGLVERVHGEEMEPFPMPASIAPFDGPTNLISKTEDKGYFTQPLGIKSPSFTLRIR